MYSILSMLTLPKSKETNKKCLSTSRRTILFSPVRDEVGILMRQEKKKFDMHTKTCEEVFVSRYGILY